MSNVDSERCLEAFIRIPFTSLEDACRWMYTRRMHAPTHTVCSPADLLAQGKYGGFRWFAGVERFARLVDRAQRTP